MSLSDHRGDASYRSFQSRPWSARILEAQYGTSHQFAVTSALRSAEVTKPVAQVVGEPAWIPSASPNLVKAVQYCVLLGKCPRRSTRPPSQLPCTQRAWSTRGL